MSRLCLHVVFLTLAVIVVDAQATVPVPEQSCAVYLGVESDSPASQDSKTNEQKQSAAYLLGKQLGSAMRQRNIANWVQGYLTGYAAATGNAKTPPSDIESLKTLLQNHCTAHADQTMLQAAEALR